MAKLDPLVFFGSPEFAVPTLEALVDAGLAPALVVTQPAKPAGRGKKPQDPPVAVWAREHELPVAQPESVKSEEFLIQMEQLAPKVAVVVAFGQIFPKRLLEIPTKGCINLHASLLPKYRGASPVQGAIAGGEKKTGVTSMQMEEELDSGPILLQEEVQIKRWDTTETLSKTLASTGAGVMVETLKTLSKIKPRKQRDESASYCPEITKRNGKADWSLEAEDFYNRLRAHIPWPGTQAVLRGRPLKIIWGVPIDWEEVPMGTVGTYLGMRQGRLAVLCGGNTLFGLERLQRPGKKAISAADFANGERLTVGERFV
jgi:methionyl-tRNA formyltransferase